MAAVLTRMRLSGGLWEGMLSGVTSPPRLLLRHRDELLGEAETVTADEKGGWFVRFRLPAERLSDGVQTFVIEDGDTGFRLAHETVIVGEAVDPDLRAEVTLLRAELDMLKRALRRHCTEEH